MMRHSNAFARAVDKNEARSAKVIVSKNNLHDQTFIGISSLMEGALVQNG